MTLGREKHEAASTQVRLLAEKAETEPMEKQVTKIVGEL